MNFQSISRKAIQLLALCFFIFAACGAVWRNYKLAHNSSRLVALIHGKIWGKLYAGYENILSLFGDSYEVSFALLGTPWASTVAGLNMVDPIIFLSAVTKNWQLIAPLFLASLVPIVMALLFGKVFCSYLCPMNLLFELARSIRVGLLRLGVPLPEFRFKERFGGWILLGGLLAAWFSSLTVWLFILPYMTLTTAIFMLITGETILVLFLTLIFWFTLEVLFAPGLFCYNLCPTGFLLEKLGHWRIWRLKKDHREPCPESCVLCEVHCPYGLSPKKEIILSGCHNCGRCIPVCPGDKLSRGLIRPGFLILFCLFSFTRVQAHHNKGLPHYGYYDNYPQVPTEEYVTIQDTWEMGATIFNFQGLERMDADTPNDVKIFLYVYDLKTERNYKGPITCDILLNGDIVTSFTRESVDEESVYSTRETMPQSGDYQLLVRLDDHGEKTLILPFHIDLSGDGANWPLILGMTMPLLILFIIAIYGQRRKSKTLLAQRKLMSAISLIFFLTAIIPVQAQGPKGPQTTQIEASNSHICESCGMKNCTMDHSLPAKLGEGEECPKCGMMNCNMVHYKTDDGGEVMVMTGIPLWLFLAGIAGIIIFSFIAIEWIAPKLETPFRYNLINNKKLYGWVKSRWFQLVPQASMIAVLFLLVIVGIFGSRIQNMTPIAVWTIWWGALIFVVMLLGPVFCFMCPWDGLANFLTRFKSKGFVKSLSMELPFPKILQNMYPAIFLFIILTWLELGYGVTTNPRTTAYMGLSMAVMAVMAALLWGGKRFCEHICPVGRISGIYANLTPLEIRGKNAKVCAACKTEDCLNGNDQGYACPTGISLKTVDNATYCTFCSECVKTCKKNNVAFNFRPFAADLMKANLIKMDEAWMALMLLSLTLFHGLSMTPFWENFEPGGQSLLKWMAITFGTSRTINFTVAMIIVCTIPIVLYWFSSWIAARWTGSNTLHLFKNYAYSLLAVALFYHLAHNAMHVLMEGGEIVPLLSDPMGTGADYFGTRNMHVGSLIGEKALWYLQVGLILTGHIFGILVAHRMGHRLFDDRRSALKSLIPILVMMILLSITGLGLMHMDMNMRVGRM